jgi:hypothetical protein
MVLLWTSVQNIPLNKMIRLLCRNGRLELHNMLPQMEFTFQIRKDANSFVEMLGYPPPRRMIVFLFLFLFVVWAYWRLSP